MLDLKFKWIKLIFTKTSEKTSELVNYMLGCMLDCLLKLYYNNLIFIQLNKCIIKKEWIRLFLFLNYMCDRLLGCNVGLYVGLYNICIKCYIVIKYFYNLI